MTRHNKSPQNRDMGKCNNHNYANRNQNNQKYNNYNTFYNTFTL